HPSGPGAPRRHYLPDDSCARSRRAPVRPRRDYRPGQDRPLRDSRGASRGRRVAGGRFCAHRRRRASLGTAGLAMIRAILRAQWLTMRFGGRGRGITVVVGVLWYGVWTLVAIAMGMTVAESDPARLRFNLPLGVLGIFAY